MQPCNFVNFLWLCQDAIQVWWVKAQSLHTGCLNQILLCWLLAVDLDKRLDFSVSHFPHLSKGDDNCTYHTEFVLKIQWVNTFKDLEAVSRTCEILCLLIGCGCYVITEYHQKPRSFTENHSWGNGQRKES